jgi:hypothetical protein
MNSALSLAVFLALAPCVALAAPPQDVAAKETTKEAAKDASKPKDCSTIKSVTVRQACLDRQAAEHPGESQQGNMGDAVEKMKREDDLLAKKLKSICKGC